MKTLKIVAAVVVAVVFISGMAIAEEEDNIAKKHEKRMAKLMAVRNMQEQAAKAVVNNKDKKDAIKDLNGTYGFIANDLADFLGVTDKKIDITNVKHIDRQDWADKYSNGQWFELGFGNYGYSEVSLEYKGKVYTYGLVAYDSGSAGSSNATLDPSRTGGTLRIVPGPYLGSNFYTVEFLRPAKSNSKDNEKYWYTVSLPYVQSRVVDISSKEDIKNGIYRLSVVTDGEVGVPVMTALICQVPKGFKTVIIDGAEVPLNKGALLNIESPESGANEPMYAAPTPVVATAILGDPDTSPTPVKPTDYVLPDEPPAASAGLELQSEELQRKDVEAQISLQKNGNNYVVCGQMADAPKEILPIQQKQ